MNRILINIASKSPPVVELDSEAQAAYVRFSHHRAKQTRIVEEDKCVVTIDLEARGAVVGVELVGVEEFTVGRLLKLAGIRAPKLMLDRASYIPAKLLAV